MKKMENKLKEIIQSRGIKQKFIADKAGISQGALSLIIRGKSIPTLPVAIRIAKVLNSSVEDLWGQTADKEWRSHEDEI
jgi:putative transcriptional regulator